MREQEMLNRRLGYLRFSILHVLFVVTIFSIVIAAMARPNPIWANSVVILAWTVYCGLGCIAIARQYSQIICGGMLFGLSYLALSFLYDNPLRSINLPTSMLLYELFDVVHGENAAALDRLNPDYPWPESFIAAGNIGISLLSALLGMTVTAITLRFRQVQVRAGIEPSGGQPRTPT